jgi:hypothetical protein
VNYWRVTLLLYLSELCSWLVDVFTTTSNCQNLVSHTLCFSPTSSFLRSCNVMFARSTEDGLKDFRKLNNAIEQASKGSVAASGDVPTPNPEESSNLSTVQAIKSILKRTSAAMSRPSSPARQDAGKSTKRKRVSQSARNISYR